MAYLNRTGIAMWRTRDELEYHCNTSDFGDWIYVRTGLVHTRRYILTKALNSVK